MSFVKTVAGSIESDKRKLNIHGTCKIRGLYTILSNTIPSPKPTSYCKVLEEICLFKQPNLSNFVDENYEKKFMTIIFSTIVLR